MELSGRGWLGVLWPRLTTSCGSLIYRCIKRLGPSKRCDLPGAVRPEGSDGASQPLPIPHGPARNPDRPTLSEDTRRLLHPATLNAKPILQQPARPKHAL